MFVFGVPIQVGVIRVSLFNVLLDPSTFRESVFYLFNLGSLFGESCSVGLTPSIGLLREELCVKPELYGSLSFFKVLKD